MEQPLYADVLLPLPLEVLFTYKVPVEWKPTLRVGCRVLVPFGNSKRLTGIVQSIHEKTPTGSRIKPILSVFDESPLLDEKERSFWSWIAGYYCCTKGEVMNAAMPAALRPTTAEDDNWLSRKEQRDVYVRLNAAYESNTQAMDEALKGMGRAKKQVELVRLFLQYTDTCVSEGSPRAILRRTLIGQAGSSSAILKQVCERGLLDCFEKVCQKQPEEPTMTLPILTSYQKTAFDDLSQKLQKKTVCLLHGYTSSGKTAIYMHLIQRCLDNGLQALFLVPEIALTTQLADRLRQVAQNWASIIPDYGAGTVGGMASTYTNNGFKVILGVRSSIFFLQKSGLVVVDENTTVTANNGNLPRGIMPKCSGAGISMEQKPY